MIGQIKNKKQSLYRGTIHQKCPPTKRGNASERINIASSTLPPPSSPNEPVSIAPKDDDSSAEKVATPPVTSSARLRSNKFKVEMKSKFYFPFLFTAGVLLFPRLVRRYVINLFYRSVHFRLLFFVTILLLLLIWFSPSPYRWTINQQ